MTTDRLADECHGYDLDGNPLWRIYSDGLGVMGKDAYPSEDDAQDAAAAANTRNPLGRWRATRAA